jgi:hypothetical protein
MEYFLAANFCWLVIDPIHKTFEAFENCLNRLVYEDLNALWQEEPSDKYALF